MYKVTTYLNEDNMPYVVKEEVKYNVTTDVIDSPDKVYELTKEMRMTERATEMVLLLILDSGNHLICTTDLSTGSIDRSIISPREIAQTMLLAGGKNCIIAHNHPSGSSIPSDMDIKVTMEIKKALELLRLTLFDHIIVARNEYTSLSEQNYM